MVQKVTGVNTLTMFRRFVKQATALPSTPSAGRPRRSASAELLANLKSFCVSLDSYALYNKNGVRVKQPNRSGSRINVMK